MTEARADKRPSLIGPLLVLGSGLAVGLGLLWASLRGVSAAPRTQGGTNGPDGAPPGAPEPPEGKGLGGVLRAGEVTQAVIVQAAAAAVADQAPMERFRAIAAHAAELPPSLQIYLVAAGLQAPLALSADQDFRQRYAAAVFAANDKAKEAQADNLKTADAAIHVTAAVLAAAGAASYGITTLVAALLEAAWALAKALLPSAPTRDPNVAPIYPALGRETYKGLRPDPIGRYANGTDQLPPLGPWREEVDGYPYAAALPPVPPEATFPFVPSLQAYRAAAQVLIDKGQLAPLRLGWVKEGKGQGPGGQDVYLAEGGRLVLVGDQSYRVVGREARRGLAYYVDFPLPKPPPQKAFDPETLGPGEAFVRVGPGQGPGGVDVFQQGDRVLIGDTLHKIVREAADGVVYQEAG